MAKQANTGIRWWFMEQLVDLDLTNDIFLLSTSNHQMQKKTEKFTESARVGLNLSKTKTHVVKLNCKNTEPIKFQNGDSLKETNDFTYLGAVVSTEGGCNKDMNSWLSKVEKGVQKAKDKYGS